MKSMSKVLGVLLLGLCVSGSALADHGHGHFRGGIGVGVVIDPFWGWPYYAPVPYYYSPAYYYPPVVAVPSQPPVYVEQERAPAVTAPPANYWYYCSGSRSYYPYVRECPGGWQRVAPQPPMVQ